MAFNTFWRHFMCSCQDNTSGSEQLWLIDHPFRKLVQSTKHLSEPLLISAHLLYSVYPLCVKISHLCTHLSMCGRVGLDVPLLCSCQCINTYIYKVYMKREPHFSGLSNSVSLDFSFTEKTPNLQLFSFHWFFSHTFYFFHIHTWWELFHSVSSNQYMVVNLSQDAYWLCYICWWQWHIWHW